MTPLVRTVRCAFPARLGGQRRSTRATATANTVAMCVAPLLIGAMLVSAFEPPRMGYSEEGNTARATVKKYAVEGYPSWRKQNPGQVCPAKLDELYPYMTVDGLDRHRLLDDLDRYIHNQRAMDPWGGTYVFSCDDAGILVWSRGEDGKSGTSDDVRSDP